MIAARTTLDTLCRESAAVEDLVEAVIESFEGVPAAFRELTIIWGYEQGEPLPMTAKQFGREIARERRRYDREHGYDQADYDEWSADAFSDAAPGL